MAISFTQLKTKYGKLSQNTASTNTDLGGEIMNQEQRYLLQKYYSNEGTFSLGTVGAQTLASTASLALGAVSATLTTAWLYHTTKTTVTFSNGDTRLVQFNRGSTAITWGVGLSAAATTVLSVGGLQFYPLPPNYSKLKSLTVSQGTLNYTPSEVQSLDEWNILNAFPFYGNIAVYYYIYNNQLGIYPIPSTTGNVITYGYKYRVTDMSLEDYTTGTVAVTSGSTTITGTTTIWTPTTNIQSEGRYIKISQTKGDNQWYEVQSVDSTTQITLVEPYQGITVSGGTYILGEMPILQEDFHDMLIYKALTYYFSTKVKNSESFTEFKSIYDSKIELLNEYAGNKTVNVDLSTQPYQQNPNLYQQNIGM